MCHHTGLVARALGCSLNLRVSQSVTTTSLSISPDPFPWESYLQRYRVLRLGLSYFEPAPFLTVQGTKLHLDSC